MGWQTWIVPIIAIGVWIISNLLRAQEERKTEKNRERPRGNRTSGSRASESKIDLERMVREVRRQMNPQQGDPSASSPPASSERRQERAPPKSRPSSAPPSSGQRARLSPAAPQTPVEEAIPVVALAVESPPVAAPSLLVLPVTPVQLPPSAAVPSITPPLAGENRIVSPRETDWTALLQSPQQLARAMVLREILAPPLSLSRQWSYLRPRGQSPKVSSIEPNQDAAAAHS